jgi:hypothetical protein
MEDNARGKRNQTRSARRYYLGARYLREKQKNGGDRKSVRHSAGLITADRIASEEGVDPRTVERAKSITIGLVSAWDLATTTEKNWRLEVERARKEAAHKRLGFKDFDAYLKATIGRTEEEAGKRFKTKPTSQGKRVDLSTVDPPGLGRSRPYGAALGGGRVPADEALRLPALR